MLAAISGRADEPLLKIFFSNPHLSHLLLEATVLFFKIAGKFITPDLSGSILSGITRMSVIDVLRDKGFEVIERPITISEIIEASKNGTLEEAFGTGTAVGIAMVGEIGNKDLCIKFPEENPVSVMVNETLNAIKVQDIEDKFGWIVEAK